MISFTNLPTAAIPEPPLTTATQPAIEWESGRFGVIQAGYQKTAYTRRDEIVVLPSLLHTIFEASSLQDPKIRRPDICFGNGTYKNCTLILRGRINSHYENNMHIPCVVFIGLIADSLAQEVRDSIASPAAQFKINGGRNFWMGKNYRLEWTTPVKGRGSGHGKRKRRTETGKTGWR